MHSVAKARRALAFGVVAVLVQFVAMVYMAYTHHIAMREALTPVTIEGCGTPLTAGQWLYKTI